MLIFLAGGRVVRLLVNRMRDVNGCWNIYARVGRVAVRPCGVDVKAAQKPCADRL